MHEHGVDTDSKHARIWDDFVAALSKMDCSDRTAGAKEGLATERSIGRKR